MSAVLRVRGLRVVRGGGAFVLRVPGLELRGGEVLAVLGPNGAGKTTLLRALAGLEEPHAGAIERPAAGAVTLVFQRPVAFSGTVLHNVRVALTGPAGAGLSRAERSERARRALAHFGIGELAERRATRLSAGELRRLSLARAFATEPAALLLDEPFDDLDAGAQEALGADLARAIEQTGVAVAVVTHDLGRATRLADRMAVLDGGRLLQEGPAGHVLDAPVSLRVAELVGMHNRFRGSVRGGWIEVDGDHRIEAPRELADGTRVWVGVRPEHVKVDVGRGERSLIGKAVVRRVSADTVLTTVWLEWAGHELVTHLISGRGLARTLAPGDAVVLSVAPRDVHLLPDPE